MYFKPSRISAWSSANTTRIMLPASGSGPSQDADLWTQCSIGPPETNSALPEKLACKIPLVTKLQHFWQI
jgi:hypothetical protein